LETIGRNNPSGFTNKLCDWSVAWLSREDRKPWWWHPLVRRSWSLNLALGGILRHSWIVRFTVKHLLLLEATTRHTRSTQQSLKCPYPVERRHL
jgi:hypothetical protein